MRMMKTVTYSSEASEEGDLKEQNQRTSRSSPAGARTLLVAFVLFLCTIVVGCVPGGSGGFGDLRIPDPLGGDDYLVKELELENAYFHGAAPFPLQPSHSYWVKRGDPVFVRWDTFEWHYQRDRKVCMFPDNISGTDCQVCDFCNLPEHTSGLPCLGNYSPRLSDILYVGADSGFFPTDNPALLYQITDAGQMIGGCTNRPRPDFAIPIFTPQNSGLHRIFSREPVLATGEAAGRVKIFLLDEASPSQVATYQMYPHDVTDPANCTPTPSPSPPDCTAWYRWSISGDAIWEDNFSPNLRVTKVQIVKGLASMDPNTGRFQLDQTTQTVVHPSRIVLIPSYQGDSVFANDTNRCFANASPDGDIDLRRCRRGYGADCNNPQDPSCGLPATPTYLNTQTLDKLTWFAEFKPSEGGIAPTLGPNEILAIEFTIERL